VITIGESPAVIQQPSGASTPASGVNNRLMTIREKSLLSESNLKQMTGKIPLPVLPPLNEARSVKEKWNILLSKAKGKD